jgi:molybdopterin converting factor small subunit
VATIHIPPQLRKAAGGERRLDVAGATLRQVLDALEARHPGILDKILDEDQPRPGMAFAIDNRVKPPGLHHPVDQDSVIHIVWAVSGG